MIFDRDHPIYTAPWRWPTVEAAYVNVLEDLMAKPAKMDPWHTTADKIKPGQAHKTVEWARDYLPSTRVYEITLRFRLYDAAFYHPDVADDPEIRLAFEVILETGDVEAAYRFMSHQR